MPTEQASRCSSTEDARWGTLTEGMCTGGTPTGDTPTEGTPTGGTPTESAAVGVQRSHGATGPSGHNGISGAVIHRGLWTPTATATPRELIAIPEHPPSESLSSHKNLILLSSCSAHPISQREVLSGQRAGGNPTYHLTPGCSDKGGHGVQTGPHQLPHLPQSAHNFQQSQNLKCPRRNF